MTDLDIPGLRGCVMSRDNGQGNRRLFALVRFNPWGWVHPIVMWAREQGGKDRSGQFVLPDGMEILALAVVHR